MKVHTLVASFLQNTIKAESMSIKDLTLNVAKALHFQYEVGVLRTLVKRQTQKWSSGAES